ncbi:MAG TPA: response regulator [Iamia sp.]|nr:response regulator [Iamia sp.]
MPTTVLVVEDDPVIIDLLTLTLELEGWTVLRAKDAVSAFEVARAESPDIVVSDVMMPGRSGLDLIADLASDVGTAGIPVILLSARALAAEVAEGYSAGAVDYVTKPFDPDDLIERIQKVLDGRADENRTDENRP